MSDSARAFFDSLAAARRRDSVVRGRADRAVYQIAARDSIESIAWLDILRDSSLVRLVDIALRQNRDLQLAQARISEFRAALGVARAPLLPSVTLNGVGEQEPGRARRVSSDVVSRRALTADLAWELDFWGRIRRGVEAANADLEAQEAAERATVLSLVSDVATSYLSFSNSIRSAPSPSGR